LIESIIDGVTPTVGNKTAKIVTVELIHTPIGIAVNLSP
jgi:hypothetical protein